SRLSLERADGLSRSESRRCPRRTIMSDLPFDDLPAEVERYEFLEPQSYVFAADRREFMGVLGAGVMIVAAAAPAGAQRRGRRGPARAERLSERFHIGEDGVVTVFTSKVE